MVWTGLKPLEAGQLLSTRSIFINSSPLFTVIIFILIKSKQTHFSFIDFIQRHEINWRREDWVCGLLECFLLHSIPSNSFNAMNLIWIELKEERSYSGLREIGPQQERAAPIIFEKDEEPAGAAHYSTNQPNKTKLF